jgi:Sel1 repeat
MRWFWSIRSWRSACCRWSVACDRLWTLRVGTEQRNTEADFNLGLLYLDGKGVRQDFTQAVAWFRKGAEQGNADAQDNLGSLYDSGQGVRQDYAEAPCGIARRQNKGTLTRSTTSARCTVTDKACRRTLWKATNGSPLRPHVHPAMTTGKDFLMRVMPSQE